MKNMTSDQVIMCRSCGALIDSLANGLAKGCPSCQQRTFQVMSRQEYERLTMFTAKDYDDVNPLIKISPDGKLKINLNKLLTKEDFSHFIIQGKDGSYHVVTEI